MCSNLKSLVEHPGWKKLDEIADGQIKNRCPSLFSRMDNLLEITAKEFDKGEVSGIELFRRMPYGVVEELEREIEELEKEIEHDDRRRGTRDLDERRDDSGSGDDFRPPV